MLIDDDRMKILGNTVLITGGATGIGFAMAKAFTESKNKVLICGRRQSNLDDAKILLPEIETLQCDISKEEGRKALFEWATSNFPELNMLVNNAGIQRQIDFKNGMADLLSNEDEIEVNLRSQIYLAARFVPFLLKQDMAGIANVSSGLGFIPLSRFPVYSATKAAIHSFTKALRHQLKDTKIKVFEIIPPTVYDTELKGRPIAKSDWAVAASEVAKATIDGIANDRYEITLGPSTRWAEGTNQEKEDIFNSMNH